MPDAAQGAEVDFSGLRAGLQAATQIAGKVFDGIEQRERAFEAASLNSARLELEKQGTQLELDLQKDRVAGDGYVRDVEEQRKKLKSDVWAKLPPRVQNSARAKAAYEEMWVGDEISAFRRAAQWQQGEEVKFAQASAVDAMNAMTAKIEANPDAAQAEIETWTRSLSNYSPMLGETKVKEIEEAGNYAATLAAVRGLANADRYEDADRVVKATAARFDDRQREGLRSAIEGIKSDKYTAENRARVEQERVWGENRAAMHTDIMLGKKRWADVEDAVKSGVIDPKDRPAMLQAIRSYDSWVESETRMSAVERDMAKLQSKLTASEILAMPPDMFVRGYESWAQADKDRFDALAPEDQAAVIQKGAERRAKGQEIDAVQKVHGDLMAQARMTMPSSWTLSGQNQSPEERAFAGAMYRIAERESRSTGGEPLTAARVHTAMPWSPSVGATRTSLTSSCSASRRTGTTR